MGTQPICNPRTRRALEFDRIVERLTALARNPIGAELTRALEPSAELTTVLRWQQETREAREMLAGHGLPPLTFRADLRPAIASAAKGIALSALDLLDFAALLQTAYDTRQYLAQAGKGTEVARTSKRLHECPELLQAIRAAIDPEGLVRDSATPALASARAEIRRLDGQLHEALDRLLRRVSVREALREPLATIRDGRFCLPVSAERQAQVRGIVHDTSASGATVFIEPESIVPLGNALRAAHRREEEEVAKVLRALTEQVGAHAALLEETLGALGALDAIFCRARLAEEMRASEPRIGDTGGIELLGARHPLLTGEVTPIDFVLGTPATVMVITGPNTGGKTVALKTAGLLVLMAQSGLQIPASAGSELPLVRQVWADIGDEQSVAQSLSTFSAHLRQIIAILAGLAPPALVLLDEIGAGTAPGEGAALARALLLHLQQPRVWVAVTTHFDALKSLAASHPGMVNASVEFDPETLSPRFHLRIGRPGGSHAFTIARRLGLPADIIESARQHLTIGEREMEALLTELASAEQDLQSQRQTAQAAAREATEHAQAAAAEAADLSGRRRAIIQRARDEARELLDAAQRQVQTWMQEAEAARRGTQGKRDLRRVAGSLRSLERQLEEPDSKQAIVTTGEPALSWPGKAAELLPGAVVRLRSVGQTGHLLTVPDADGEAEVQVGVLRVRVPAGDLELLAEPRGRMDLASRAESGLSDELHLLGLSVSEAEFRLERYLDQAHAAGLERCRIVHGMGTGALRGMVRTRSAAHPGVFAARPGERGEGGEGVTVVELRGPGHV